MVTAAQQIQLTGLARCLVQAGHMEDADALAHHEESIKKKVPFVSYLVENKILDSISIAHFRLLFFRYRFRRVQGSICSDLSQLYGLIYSRIIL